MIFWAGLRGAVAFALSFQVEGKEKSVVQSTILIVCVISILFLGGSTPSVINYLKIETTMRKLPNQSEVLLNDDPDRLSESDFGERETRIHWFLSVDEKYIKPFFCKKVEPVGEQYSEY